MGTHVTVVSKKRSWNGTRKDNKLGELPSRESETLGTIRRLCTEDVWKRDKRNVECKETGLEVYCTERGASSPGNGGRDGIPPMSLKMR